MAERLLRESADEISETRHRALVDAAGAVVTEYDVDGRRTYVSPDAGRVMGFDPKTLFASSPIKGVHPEDRPAVLDRIAELREARRIPPFRYRYRVQSGAWRPSRRP